MEEAGPGDNALTTLSMLKQFHANGKYSDVQLQIGGELFKCQRSLLAAISEYFDTMFSSGFKVESDTRSDQPIILHEIDATSFKEILHFLYTGDVRVKRSNVYQLLLINDFLRLRTAHVKEQCIEWVKTLLLSEGHGTLTNVFDLFSFACMKTENILIDILNAHFCQHLNYYSKRKEFLRISFENLNTLLKFAKNYILSFPGSQNVILKMVLNWVNDDREERGKYRHELLGNINFSNVSADFMSLLINGLETLADNVTGLPNNAKSLGILRILKSGIMENQRRQINIGDDQFNGTITFVTPLSKMETGKRVYSLPRIISNLSWKIYVMRSNLDKLSFYLHCEGTSDKRLLWNCCASANLSIVSHKEGENDYVLKLPHHIFSYGQTYKNRGYDNFLDWKDVIDPEEGYVKDNSITLRAEVHTGIPFEKKTT